MKGIVFNLLEAVVAEAYGEDEWDEIVDAAGVDGAYTSLGSYDDAQLLALVGAASARLQLPPDDVVLWFGRETIPHFVARYGPLFEAHPDTRSFVLALNDTIHPEVRKLYPGAETPMFSFDTSSPDRLVVEYRSPRKLCAFAEGLIHGCAAHYGEAIDVTHAACLKGGDDRCVLILTPTA